MTGIRGADYIDENGKRVLTGGLLAASKNLEKNPNFYREIGKLGGSVLTPTGGFAANRDLARRMGKIGGRISRRKPKTT